MNYLGSVWCLRAFAPGLQAAGAHVVNLVSVAGTVAFAPAGAYAASKHAQLAFSRSTAALLRPRGIQVHTVMPGFVETEGFPQRAKLRSRMLTRYVIEADDVAEAVVKAVEKGKSEVTVPWFPYRLAAIGQALVPGLFSRLVTRRADEHRDDSGYGPGLRETYQPTSISYGAAGAGPRIRIRSSSSNPASSSRSSRSTCSCVTSDEMSTRSFASR